MILTRRKRQTATIAIAAIALAGFAAPVAHGAEYIVQFDAGVTSAGARRAVVEHAGGTVTRDARLINAAGAELSPGEVDALRADAAVSAVTSNGSVTPTATRVNFDPDALATAFNQSAGTSRLWKRATGKGVGVAVIDTGVAGDLPDFRVSQSDPSSRVVASAVVNPDATSADDAYGHGTVVAGILAGNSGNRDSGDPLRGRYAGAAPDADIVAVKIADEQGNASVLDAINGIQFAVDHKAEYNIRVINLSFESNDPQSYKIDPLDAAVESAWFSGIVVVAAAGNRGSAANAVGYAPGNDPYAITVGAVDDRGTKSVKDDVVASWSSRGVTQDSVSKPELYAPGAHIVSNLAPGSAFGLLCPDCIRDRDYIQAGGTSLAAPIVAGAVAAILEQHPDWTPDMVKAALVTTTRSLSGSDAREIDALAASNAFEDELAPANGGLTPNQIVNAATGEIDYAKATWTKATWTKATWTKATWTCVCDSSAGGTVDPAKATWTKATWTTDWSK